jgi:hypothetical protein
MNTPTPDLFALATSELEVLTLRPLTLTESEVAQLIRDLQRCNNTDTNRVATFSTTKTGPLFNRR